MSIVSGISISVIEADDQLKLKEVMFQLMHLIACSFFHQRRKFIKLSCCRKCATLVTLFSEDLVLLAGNSL